MILPLYAALERLDRSLLEAGKDLYASATQTFLRVTLPLTMPGIIAGVLLTFIPAAGDYVNVTFLGGTNQAMIGNVIQSKYLVVNDYPDRGGGTLIHPAGPDPGGALRLHQVRRFGSVDG